ncbi:MAG: response regulator [Pseudomonadota bacterium]
MAVASPPKTIGDSDAQTILLVDDDRLILATLSRGLSAGGFRTLEAACGADALKVCAENPPCIAIIDYDMPGMTGLELLARLQSDGRFPVIILSAYGDETIVSKAVELGAMAYLVKPIDPSKLVPTIRTVIRRYNELAALRTESAQLNSALKAARATSVVVGLLMERLRLTEKQAYERLRQFCRSHNRKVTEVASEILGTAEQLNAFIADIGEGPARMLAERKPAQDPGARRPLPPG